MGAPRIRATINEGFIPWGPLVLETPTNGVGSGSRVWSLGLLS